MVEVQYRTQMMFNMKMYVSNSFTFYFVLLNVWYCFALFFFCQSHFFGYAIVKA